MAENDGGPAFPSSADTAEGHAMKDFGMSLRDYFAAKAMQSLIHEGGEVRVHTEDGILVLPASKGIPKVAYQYADAMIAEREE